MDKCILLHVLGLYRQRGFTPAIAQILELIAHLFDERRALKNFCDSLMIVRVLRVYDFAPLTLLKGVLRLQ